MNTRKNKFIELSRIQSIAYLQFVAIKISIWIPTKLWAMTHRWYYSISVFAHSIFNSVSTLTLAQTTWTAGSLAITIADKDFRQGSWTAHHCTSATIYCVVHTNIHQYRFHESGQWCMKTEHSMHLHEFVYLFISINICVNIMGTSCSFILFIIISIITIWLATKWVVIYFCHDVTN